MPAVKNPLNMGKKQKKNAKLPNIQKQEEQEENDWVDASDDEDEEDAESDIDQDDDADDGSELNSSEYEALDRDVDTDEEEEGSDDQDDSASDISLESVEDEEEPAKVLEKLKEKDPEFYQFLLENDKELLENEDEDEDDRDGGEDDDDDQDESDEDAAEVKKRPDKRKGGKIKVTPAVVRKWADALAENPSVEQISQHIYALKAAVNTIVDESEKDKKFKSDFIIDGNETFNALISSCFIDLLPAIHKHLKLPPPTSKAATSDSGLPFDPAKSKRWKGFISIMKCYLIQILKILETIVEPEMKSSLLRHVLYLVPFYIKYNQLMKRLLLTNMNLWSEYDNDKVRVLSFLCILRILRNQQAPAQNYILKKLHLSYVKNCKFVNKETLPNIAFMRQSLVELYSLDQEIAYQHCFVYSRQLAISLRNAMVQKKKDSFKGVYCWPFIHSLLLWVQLITCLYPSDVLKPLIYPLVQIMLGAIKLIPVAKYFPLRFHLVKALIKLSESTKVFIPILPLLTDVLEQIQYNKMSSRKKPVENQKKLRPLELDLYLRVSRDMVHDKRYIETIVNRCHDLMLEYLANQSHRIAFPELTFVSLVKLKSFVKSCPVAHHVKLFKELIAKSEETSNMITEKRKTVTFGISDTQAVDAWEATIQDNGTPLLKHFSAWKKIREQEEKEWRRQDEEVIKKQKERGLEEELQSESDQEASDELKQDKRKPSKGGQPKEQARVKKEKFTGKDKGKKLQKQKGAEQDKGGKMNSKPEKGGKRKKKRPSQNLRKRMKLERQANANLQIPNAALEVSSDED